MLPLTQIGGRALFNVVAGLYVAWGLLSLWSRGDRLDRSTTLLYLALLGVALAGIPGSVDPVGGLRVWIQFAAQTSTLLLVQAALRESPENIDRLLAAMALFGGIALAGLYLLLPYHWFEWSGRLFNPLTQLQEDNLPFLLPFLLGWIWRYGDRRWRYGAMLGVVVAALGYVAISEGRAALVGLIVGLAGFCWAVLAWRPRWVALLAVGCWWRASPPISGRSSRRNWTSNIPWMPLPPGAPLCGGTRWNILPRGPGWVWESPMRRIVRSCCALNWVARKYKSSISTIF